ncbi:hypothetical protein [Halorubrum distributum]|uniref:Uncharacterized protein n=1 Tax=Halorubrum distributum JCM 13916 TaxID=1230455 RepID=M0PRR9_9EURY|nr:hypothetical protein [Halorubrum arcis]EMA72646.1 hypothetical protein C462_00801 [Halorubrum arcis JCM 13916]
MYFDTSGFDDLEDSIELVDGENEIEFEELFSHSFMRQYTKFDGIEEFFEESPWEVEDEEDFEEIPDDEFDEYVENTTILASWESMVEKAVEKWMADQIDF